MVLRRHWCGLTIEEFWFDEKAYRASNADIICLRSHEPVRDFDCMIPERTLFIDLSKPIEEIFRDLKPRDRNYIRSLEKQITVTKADSAEERDTFYRYYRPFAEERKIAVVDPSEEAELELFFARNAIGEIVHVSAYLPHGPSGIYRSRYSVAVQKSHSNILIVWYALREAYSRGFKFFDMGGIPLRPRKRSELEGIYVFKTRFGGKEKDIFLYLKSNRMVLKIALKTIGRMLHYRVLYSIIVQRLMTH
jgi:lipid II:glycine glycyltransferase (peptidoglycan interpeptide bridge formation enzyme)